MSEQGDVLASHRYIRRKGFPIHRPDEECYCDTCWLYLSEEAGGDPERAALVRTPETLDALLVEFDGSVCPACHHRAHDPGSCSECPRCELHTDEALAFVLRYEPTLLTATAAHQTEHADRFDCWCGPTKNYEDPATGNQVWVHRDIVS